VKRPSQAEQAWFIPGFPGAPEGPLARYRPIQPVGAVKAYVQSLTRPGDLVVDLFCQGPVIVRETVAAGRRALGLSVNPVLLAASRLGLSFREATALNAARAATRLADSLKGDVPLHRHLLSLYSSTCPTCGTPGVAVWFAWDRDGNYPFRKAVRCPTCAEVQEGALDNDDLQTSQRIKPRGLAFYYALDRVVPPGHPARERAAELVALYTPRNLSALMDLSRRLEGLEAGEEVKLALAGVLLDCFDAGSSLDPYGEERPRPRTLRVPSRYLERNIWLCFEESLSRLLTTSLPMGGIEGGEEYTLVSHAARDVRKTIPAGSAALVFVDPPRPDGVFWALSALWAGWLWETPSAHAMRPFLRRRRFDWDWHWRTLQAALKAAGPLLNPEGHMIVLFSDPDDTLLESVCLAASGAGYILEGWGYAPEVGYRLVWRWEPDVQSVGDRRLEIAALERDLIAVVEESAVGTLRQRGEPTSWPLLHTSAYAELTERGVLARAAAIPEDDPPVLAFTATAVRRAFESAPVTPFAGQERAQERAERTLWWLVEPYQVTEPLTDRVEGLVWKLLRQQSSWSLEELVNAVYARFPGSLTPDLTLVQVCVESYSVQEEGEMLRSRPEDDPQQRTTELKTLRENLVELGQRMEFKVRRKGHWDVRWQEEDQDAYAFAISATARLAPHLLAGQAADEGAQRCLVVPGGRAQLIALKLQRDPRLARAVEADGWQFIKFRHLRRLIAKEELDRHALKTVLGLDPIAEQEAAQIPLF
jgi:hypothetical protein